MENSLNSSNTNVPNFTLDQVSRFEMRFKEVYA